VRSRRADNLNLISTSDSVWEEEFLMRIKFGKSLEFSEV
jgi:hypothetical protein